MMIYSKKIIPLKLVRQTMYAWTLICKECDCSNLPLDPVVLNQALMLLNCTVSENLLKQWIKKVHPMLECEQPDRKKLELKVREIETQVVDPQSRVPLTEKGNHNSEKLFAHEFLFLVANSLDRRVELRNVGMEKIDITKEELFFTHDGIENYDGQRLDKIYNYNEHKRKVRQNPKKLMH